VVSRQRRGASRSSSDRIATPLRCDPRPRCPLRSTAGARRWQEGARRSRRGAADRIGGRVPRTPRGRRTARRRRCGRRSAGGSRSDCRTRALASAVGLQGPGFTAAALGTIAVVPINYW